MRNSKIILGLFSIGLIFYGCEQSKEVNQEEKKFGDKKVQEVVDELGLVYVEEGAKEIITYDEVIAAQEAWCKALVEIGRLKEEGGDFKAYAEQVLTDAYNYDYGKVFFKPTLTHGDQTFRNTKAGALAYFVGGDSNFPNDKGFALNPWVNARFENTGGNKQGIQIYGSVAITMGNVWVMDKEGNEVMVDKTWVFKKGEDGKLRIIVHKSSLPYNPAN
ncbi:hypothetical protein ACFOUP_13425 [Belliella kenyensis]|uniref:Phosphoribosyl-AMP cyclohydrolase n=1 Tax=Belliella kenyensis TaxID=1472724 RepID=A0ABV8EM48_9BACT|nr:hypothetical protein [Belliella kenyensis]MCH7403619.1 hypothetical protein [Belliella kenyensis]MDN3603829.1 hypothetical protein [Belliella kenyensis]